MLLHFIFKCSKILLELGEEEEYATGFVLVQSGQIEQAVVYFSVRVINTDFDTASMWR
jgi:hypothetical protein